MLQLKCNQLDHLKCNHCLPLLNQSKDTWFQAMVIKRTNWSWGFLMHSLRAGSECVSLVGRHVAYSQLPLSFQSPGESQGVLTQGCSHTSGPDEDLWTLQGFSSNLCFLAICARTLPPPKHLLSHLLFTASFLFPIFSLIPTEGWNVLVSSWWYQHFLLWVCAFISPLSFRPSLPSPDDMNEEFLCIS